MFNLTKEIELDKKNYTLYKKFQIILYLGVFLSGLFLAYLIIFPNLFFSFSFSNSSSLKNTVYNPRLQNNAFPEKGAFQKNLLFNTNLFGDYSIARINLITDKKSSTPDSLSISVRKSYQAFLYPNGESIGFKNGSLLKNSEKYYLVSNGEIRKFSNYDLIVKLGYATESFRNVSEKDLGYNAFGKDIEDNGSYPDHTLFIVDDNYYILENQKLKKFISDRAFLSGYNSPQALKRDSDFINKYPVAEDLAGFSDGTLISNNNSVFGIAQNQIIPIADIATFENKGFDWNNVIAVGSDEISIYQKGKLFTLNTPHFDGLVLKTVENSQYYIIKDFKKHLLPTENIALSWLKNNPMLVSEKSFEVKATCNPKKSILNSKSYSCDIPLDVFENIIGTSYEFNLNSNTEIKLDTINVDFQKNINNKNFKGFFSDILTRIKQNYAPNEV